MPWQFVEMYGQSNVVDYLIERALTAHSELLLACSSTTTPASRRQLGAVGTWSGDAAAGERPDQDKPSEAPVLARLITTRRIVAACWWTLSDGVEPSLARSALERDSQLAEVLADLTTPAAGEHLLADILDSSSKTKTKAALTRVLDNYRLDLPGAGRSIADETRFGDDDLAELAIGWVESDAAAWREVDGVSGVVVEGGVFASDSILRAFDRGAFRAQRWLAKPKASHARRLANHARRLSWQLALMRSALGEENRALAWYSDKLVGELTDLSLVEHLLSSPAIVREEGKDALRVRGALDARSEQGRGRVEKLIARVYGQSRGSLAELLEEEIAALDVDRQIVLVAPVIT